MVAPNVRSHLQLFSKDGTPCGALKVEAPDADCEFAWADPATGGTVFATLSCPGTRTGNYEERSQFWWPNLLK
jgi:hypothetical protein